VWVVAEGRVSALDPANGHVLTRRLDGGVAAHSMAFHGSTAYLVEPARDRVLALRAGSTIRINGTTERGGPRAVVALHGAVQPTSQDKNLIPFIFRGADTSFLAQLSRLPPILAWAGNRAVWLRRAHGLLLATVSHSGTVARGTHLSSRRYVVTGTRVRQVVMTASGGCFISVQNSRDVRSHHNLLYFSRAALRASKPRPTAVHRGREVRDLAVNPAGGVAYADDAGRLLSWVP
jgi:hypothetical protein